MLNDTGDYVIILHGIARSSNHMNPLSHYLQQEGFDVINIDYPSTKYSIEHLTDILIDEIIEKTPENKTIHFVGYSMGGLLVRAIINKKRPQKLGRVVQLAPPNHGSEVADFLQHNWLYKMIFGPAGSQLTTNNTETAQLLGKVDYELGIIAGNNTIDPISSYIIGGENDGKVSIESTKLDGMKDHIIVPSSHMFFPDNKDVKKQTCYFLKNGKFDRT